MAVIYPNVRGSSGYGKAFESFQANALRQVSSNDVQALFAWIAAQPGLDPNRVAIVAAGAEHLNLNASAWITAGYRCYIKVPAVEGVFFTGEAEDSTLQLTSRFAVDQNQAPNAPQADLGLDDPQLKKPIMLVAGTPDRREVQRFAAHLKGNGAPVWFLIAGDEGSVFQKKANRDFYFYATVLFLEQFVLK